MTRATPILLFFLSLLGAGCEGVSDPDDIPYVERLVVNGVLTDGDQIRDIRITRTLPLDKRYDTMSALVTDAEVYIDDGSWRYRMVYDTARHSYGAPITAVEGEEYTLTAEWHGKRIRAHTRIPSPPLIMQVTARDTLGAPDRIGRYYAGVEVLFKSTDPRAVLGVEILTSLEPDVVSKVIPLDSRSRLYQPRDTIETGAHRFYFEGRHPMYVSVKETKAVVHAFDAAFYDFFSSYYFSSEFSITQEESIHWNVEGDGIGLFIGRSMAERKF